MKRWMIAGAVVCLQAGAAWAEAPVERDWGVLAGLGWTIHQPALAGLGAVGALLSGPVGHVTLERRLSTRLWLTAGLHGRYSQSEWSDDPENYPPPEAGGTATIGGTRTAWGAGGTVGLRHALLTGPVTLSWYGQLTGAHSDAEGGSYPAETTTSAGAELGLAADWAFSEVAALRLSSSVLEAAWSSWEAGARSESGVGVKTLLYPVFALRFAI